MQGFSEPTSEICPFILVNHDQTKKSHHLTRTPTNFAQFWFSTSCTSRAFGCTLHASLSGASGECPMASPAHAVRGSRPPTDVERLRVEGHAVPELFRFLGGFLNHVKTWGLPAVRFLGFSAFGLVLWLGFPNFKKHTVRHFSRGSDNGQPRKGSCKLGFNKLASPTCCTLLSTIMEPTRGSRKPL